MYAHPIKAKKTIILCIKLLVSHVSNKNTNIPHSPDIPTKATKPTMIFFFITD